jgi:hypothetical protein
VLGASERMSGNFRNRAKGLDMSRSIPSVGRSRLKEFDRSGTDAPVPTWALLRLFSLLVEIANTENEKNQGDEPQRCRAA